MFICNHQNKTILKILITNTRFYVKRLIYSLEKTFQTYFMWFRKLQMHAIKFRKCFIVHVDIFRFNFRQD